MRTVSLPLAFALCSLLALPVTAQPLPDSSEFPVNTYTTGIQVFPSVARDSAGNFVIVWNDRDRDGDGYGVFGQRFGADGSLQGSDFPVNTYTTSAQFLPRVAMDADGDFVVVWQSEHTGDADVFARRFDSTGAAQGTEFRVNTYTTSNQSRPRVAMDPAGNFVVVWDSYTQDGSNYGIFARRFDGSGIPQSGEFQANTYTTGPQFSANVAGDGSGNFVIVWESQLQDGSFGSIFGQRYTAGGTEQGGEFQAGTDNTFGQYRPSVSRDDAGNFVVAWTSRNQDGSGLGIFGQRFASSGLPLEPEFQVNTYTTSYQTYPFVASEPAGGFVVSWASYGQEGAGSSYGIFGQRYDAGGDADGSEFQVNTYTTSAQLNTSVAMDAAGNFVVTWQSHSPDGLNANVIARRYCAAPAVSAPLNDAACPGGDASFSVVPSGLGPFSYQWRKNGLDLSNGGGISGADAATLNLTGLDFSDEGDYDCVVQDSCATPQMVTSEVAQLNVITDAGDVGDSLRVDKDAASITITWDDVPGALVYIVYEDTEPDGMFLTETGTASSGTTGVSIPTPAETLYFLVAAQNPCGTGPKN